MSGPLRIAIDGPAASGKGTLGRLLAVHYGLRHLDTGLTYRAVAAAILDASGDLASEEDAVAIASGLDLASLGRDRLASHSIGDAASRVAVMPKLRKVLVERQREFAEAPPGAVLDGRDIGTVVLPQAQAKLYVTASPEIRARRRAAEILDRGMAADEQAVLADIRRRDARDMARADSPLRPAADAYLLDTSGLDIEAAFQAAVEYIDRAIASRS